MHPLNTSSLAHWDIRFPSGTPFAKRREHNEVLALVSHILETPGVGLRNLKPGPVILEALSGGRSAARVFKMTPLLGSGHQSRGTPVVVKIAPRAEAECERANYDTFVRSLALPTSRPELLAFTRAGDHAALCYSFVGGGTGQRPDTLTDWLQRGDGAMLDLLLRSVFDLMSNAWYSPDHIREERGIAKRYLDRYFKGIGAAFENEERLTLCASRYFNAQKNDGRHVIGGASFPSPFGVLFSSDDESPYRSCILHGDLNTDNVIVAHDRSYVALVDFQRTGRGHVYEDLVALEASVRINDPSGHVYSEIFEIERLIALGTATQFESRYAKSIRKIRKAAFRYFDHVEDEATYHFAVAAIGLRLMQATDLSHAARARITASSLWAAKLLAEKSPISL